MKRFLAVLCCCLLLGTTSSSAHVLVSDERGRAGAIIHIMPDDDPVAGEPATIYIDSSLLQGPSSEATLTVTHGDAPQNVPLIIDNGLATGEVIFPEQGAYVLRAEITSNDELYVFEHSQRVSRGIGSTQAVQPLWAQLGVVAGISGLVCLISLGTTYRRAILARSR